jgi:ssDNA-binding Zn-finger/Zn-ribbon topoisomerase 1
MVQREATKGKNAGNKFWGCSQFPKCRGVLTLDEEMSEVEATTQAEPVCPNCNGAMVKRVSKKGKNVGNEFWGCQSFPKCRGVVAIDAGS